MSKRALGRKRPRERPPQGQASGTWTMAKHSAVQPRYPIKMTMEVFEVLHPPKVRFYPCCGLLLKPAEHELMHQLPVQGDEPAGQEIQGVQP